MLTRFIEGKRIKAHCYWPSTMGQVDIFGDISVELLSTETDDKICRRTFKVCKIDEPDSSLEVLHIHYTEWPDFGVPESPKNITAVINDIENFKEAVAASPDAPVIVHCSAGIGRTGTLLAIISFMEFKKINSPSPNIPKIVSKLRKQRMGMVQTFEQYSFIYSVVNSLTCV